MFNVLRADWLLGRRFSFVRVDADGVVRSNDFTFVAFDPFRERIRVHAEDGSRAWFPFDAIVKLFDRGELIESDKGGPFTLPDHDQAVSKWNVPPIRD